MQAQGVTIDAKGEAQGGDFDKLARGIEAQYSGRWGGRSACGLGRQVQAHVNKKQF